MRPRGTAGQVPMGYRALAVLVRAVVGLLRWRLDVTGTSHVPPTGGAVVVWNHTSHVDMVTTALPILDELGRPVRPVALRSLWRRGVVGIVVRVAGCIPVDRHRPDGRHEALGAAVAAARAGDLVLIAPEGGISTTGELQPFHTGAVRIAQEAAVPVVPTVSWGTQRFATSGLRPSLRRGWRLQVVVRYGEPVLVPPGVDPVAATAALERRMADMLGGARRDHRSDVTGGREVA